MFSIVIPYYKKSLYIKKCLDAVMAQTYQDFEVILVDDGSKDTIKEIIEKDYKDKVKLITKENEGVSKTRNRGVYEAKYDYIAFLDADDEWHPEYLAFSKKVVEKHPDFCIVGSHYTTDKNKLDKIGTQLKYKKIDDYFKIAIINTLFTSSSSIVKKSYFEHNDGFDPHLRSGQDTDLWFRIILNGGGVYFIENTLMFYSQEDTQGVTKLKQNLTIPLEDILLGNIQKKFYPLCDKMKNDSFNFFLSKLIYFHLYKYYFTKKFQKQAKEILNNNKHYYFLLHLIYYLPFPIGKILIENPKSSKLIRNYMKFIFRYVYK